jgi:ketosteroid isomerase-like protein
VSAADQVRPIFAAFDAKDVSAFASFMTDDVRLRLGNAEPVEGKSAFVETVNAFLASITSFRHEIIDATPSTHDCAYRRHRQWQRREPRAQSASMELSRKRAALR